MKLRVVLIIFRTGLTPTLWYEAQIWAVSEHGLSLFAAAVLAIRPIFAYVSSSLTSLKGTIRSKSVSVGLSSSIRSGGELEGSNGTGSARESRTRRILVGWWIQPLKPLLFTRCGSESRVGKSMERSRNESVSVVGSGCAPGGGGGGGGWEDVELGGFWKQPEEFKPRVAAASLE